MREENGENVMENTEGNMGLKRSRGKGKQVQGRRQKMMETLSPENRWKPC